MDMQKRIVDRVNFRIKKISWDLATIISFSVDIEKGIYLAGNSLNKDKPNDYDLYPVRKGDFDDIDWNKVTKSGEYTVLTQTPNAVTVKIESSGVILQFCNYQKKDLGELVDSFDFAHVKLGALIKWHCTDEEIADFNSAEIDEIYLSDHFIEAKIGDTTFYTGSEYPLGSLMRLFKYSKRGDIPGRAYMREVIIIMRDILKRGYSDYEDFKNQLDAVDLQWVSNDEFTELIEFYQLVAYGEIKPEGEK